MEARGWVALAATAAAIALTATSASGATRFAEPGGAGPAATCPQTDPCDIQVAVEDAAAGTGDVIVLLPGTYDLGADNLALDHELTVGGRPTGPRPTITGTGSSVVTVVGNSLNTRLHDVVIEGTGAFGFTSVQTVERVESTASFTACLPGFEGLIRDSTCVAYGTQGEAVSYRVGCGAPQTLDTRRLRNVTAHATGADSAAIRVDANGGCDLTLSGRNVIAMAEGTDVVAFTDEAPGSSAELQLSRSAFNSELAFGTNAVVPSVGSGTNLAAEPLLADPMNGDLRQLPGSPTIDAGGEDELVGPMDFEGDPRVVGGRIDIGADEFTDTCGGRSATIVADGSGVTRGTSGPDVIRGTPGRDDIRAKGGRDLICARGGRDIVKAGGGRDRVNGGGAKDRLFGQGGRDRLVGGAGRGDLCSGGPGRDSAARSCERIRSVP